MRFARTAALAAALMASSAAAEPPAQPPQHGPRVSLNQDYIEGNYATLDVTKPEVVFAHVFAQLPATVTIYPTENYFYWSFPANGRMYWGNFRLDAQVRDQGVLNIGYFEYDENGKFQDYDGYDKEFTEKDGVILKKVSRFVYTVTYKDKTVTFRLHDIGMTPPQKAKLRPDEKFVGPVYDESGVRFFIIFNTTENHFHYVLNEDGPPAETYRDYGKGTDVVIGRRTGFAYYLDKENDRKILIAVNGANTMRNNYYDGPFDQAPDNYADETHLKDYLELAYPSIKGKISKYGHFLDKKGVRAAVYAYYVYFDERDLNFVQSCRRTRQSKARFYACITPDPQAEAERPPAKRKPRQ
ncbi:MAG: hypothetical protein KIT16_09260 [Rhodospirillaceae bacterium]|nr:hypothetical protein [Rhodospirillaceae bacterium]